MASEVDVKLLMIRAWTVGTDRSCINDLINYNNSTYCTYIFPTRKPRICKTKYQHVYAGVSSSVFTPKCYAIMINA
jgi:hypothetical protein